MIAACLMSPALGCPGTAAPAPSALYTASDFPALARGVDPGFTGEAAVSVWAPSQDELEPDGR